MIHTIIAFLLFAIGILSANADKTGCVAKYDNIRLERNGNYLSIDVDLDLSGLEVETNRAVLLTPRLVNGEQTLELPSVAVYGRRRYYHYKRNMGELMLSGKEETTLRSGEIPSEVAYHQLVPYEEWLNGATLIVERKDYGCCKAPALLDPAELATFLEEPKEFFPLLVYIQPKAQGPKMRSLKGQAYVDFPVDQTVIYADYHNNTAELERVRLTIDTVRNDPDATIDTVWLKGWASPESPYAHNTDLAKGRTKALMNYIQNLYNFTGVAMLTDYEPENWEGLRKDVEKSNLEHKAEILAMIDMDMDPDAKEAKIKKTYPEEYRFMLQTYYPYLRRTDYRVSYHIRSYSDPVEILRIMAEKPQNLSLDEFHIAANTLEPGSPEFAEVFETAVRMYPDDEIANLNAANAAMRRGDNERAATYLAKAGNSPEAIYARGALAIRNNDYTTARTFMKKAEQAGIAQAAETLAELDKRDGNRR